MTKAQFEAKKEPKKTELTVMQSIVTGSIAGAVEVLVDHPLWSIKTRMQSGASFTLNPQVLYRGILPNAASMIPITAAQVGLDRFFQERFFGSNYKPTDKEKLATAFAAGAGSAVFGCPTEMIMTHQKTSFYSTGVQLVKQGGLSSLYTGLLATMLRDGMFTAFCLGVTPILKGQIERYYPHELSASVASGVIAGVGATLGTQAIDTVKTTQQAKSAGFLASAQSVYASRGLYGFFNGSLPRGVRVVSAVTQISLINEGMKKLFVPNEEEEQIGKGFR